MSPEFAPNVLQGPAWSRKGLASYTCAADDIQRFHSYRCIYKPVSARCQPFLSNMEAACDVDMMEKRVESVTNIRASYTAVA